MANNFLANAQTLISRTVNYAVRVNSQIIKTINTDISAETIKGNNVIRIQLPSDNLVAEDFNGTLVIQDLNTNYVEMTLEKKKHVAFEMSDDDIHEFSADGYLTEAVQNSLNALGQDICKAVIAGYKDVYNFVGTSDDNSSANYNTDLLFDAQEKLLDIGVKMATELYGSLSGRFVLAITKELKTFDKSGSFLEGILVNGVQAITKISNILILRDGQLESIKHVSGTAHTDTVTVSVDAEAGDTSIVLAGTNGKTFKKGDLFTISGVSQQFVVKADTVVASGVATVQFAPALKVDVADTTAVEVLGNHDVNLVYARDWQVFAMRALFNTSYVSGATAENFIMGVADEETGMTFKFESQRGKDHDKYNWSFMSLYGTKVARPELCVRVLRPVV